MSFLTLLLIFFASSVHAIINGTAITKNDTFTVAIFQPALSAISTPFICSGVLITPTTVLTLAECVSGLNPSDLQIRTGTTPSTYTNTTITSIHPHPNYSSDTLTNDIAILHLGKNITHICPATLAPKNETSSSVRILGWGPVSNNTQAISSSLHQVSVPTIPRDSCAKTLSPCFNLSSQHFCTRVSSAGVAYGDFGGPVLDYENRLMGLISGNPTCAAGNEVALQVSVLDDGIRNWVLENVL